jgi:hypothetical protein
MWTKNTIFWNIRGFGVRGRRTLLKDYLRTHHIDIVCLQETIKQDFTDQELRSLEVGEKFIWWWLPATDTQGVCWWASETVPFRWAQLALVGSISRLRLFDGQIVPGLVGTMLYLLASWRKFPTTLHLLKPLSSWVETSTSSEIHKTKTTIESTGPDWTYSTSTLQIGVLGKFLGQGLDSLGRINN